MQSLLVRVRKKMSIAAQRKMRGILEGEYSSVFKGRSMDFEDLRLYATGDDIKDIDWKATARSSQILIRRYVALKKYNFLFVVDTSHSMAALAPSQESKKDIAVMASGVITSVALSHGDLVGMVSGDSQKVEFLPLKESRSHAERMLQRIYATSLQAAPRNLEGLLEYVRKYVRKRTMLIIISDEIVFAENVERLLKRLLVQHEILYLQIADADLTTHEWQKSDVLDVDRSIFIPKSLRSNNTVKAAFAKHLESERRKGKQQLKRLGIQSVMLDSEDAVVQNIISLLEEKKHAKR